MPAKQNDSEDLLLSILRHPLRKRLLRLYVEAEGTLSPKELTLLANGAVELVETQPRRGSVEHFYKATDLVDEVPWGRAALRMEAF